MHPNHCWIHKFILFHQEFQKCSSLHVRIIQIFFLCNLFIYQQISLFKKEGKSDSLEVRTIKEKSIFGHEIFFGHGTWSDKKSYSVRSKGISKILSIKLSDMLDLLNEFP